MQAQIASLSTGFYSMANQALRPLRLLFAAWRSTTSNSAFVQILNNDINIGGLGTNLVRNLQTTPFKATILDNLPFNHKVGFLFEMIIIIILADQTLRWTCTF